MVSTEEDLGESGINITQNSNSEDELFFSSPTMKKMLEVMVIQTFDRLLKPTLEKLVRNVVKHEFELTEKKFLFAKGNPEKDIQAPKPRSLKLKFLTKVSVPVLTGVEIKGVGGNAIELALVDDNTGEIVDSGPEASAKVEIVVLRGEFGDNNEGNWTVEEFCSNVVRQREGRKSLLAETVHVRLDKGIGYVDKIKFTHSSIYMKMGMFRLGARVVDTFNRIQVKEARTESFTVKDRRQQLYKKHNPPSLLDEVWRLEKIGKDGAFHRRLSKERVNTVKDFLTLLYLDPTRLRDVLGTGVSTKMWEVMVEHARTCLVDKKVYLYYTSVSVPKTGVVFNIVGQVMGLFPDCQYVSADKLSETQKDDARNLVICAFRHWEEVVSFEDESSLIDWVMQISTVQFSPNSPMVGNSDASNNILASKKRSRSEFQQLSVSTPDIMPSFCSIADFSSLDDYVLHGIDNMDVRFDQPLNFPGQDTNSLMADTDSITRPSFWDDDHLPFLDTDHSLPSPSFAPSPDLQCAVNSFLAHSSTIVPLDKAQRRWKMLISVLRWFSVRRIVNRRTIIS